MANDEIPLHRMIQSLRWQLERSMEDAEKAKLRFQIGTIDLELKVAATEQADVEGGFGWSIVKFGAKVGAKDETVHTLRISLIPERPDGADVRVSGAVRAE